MPSSTRPRVSFFTSGTRLPHKDSYIIVNQSYVQYLPPFSHGMSSPAPASKLPILFIHGGGLTGASWESTPDLRPGWAPLAARLGYEVYILDTIDSGRSGRAPDHIRGDAEIEHRTAGEMWSRFRFGALDGFENREAFKESQFPVEYYDALVGAQCARRRTNDVIERKGIVDVLKVLGECWVIAHSHGAALMTEIISEVGHLVKRMAFVEPGGTSIAQNLLKEVPTMVFWGDYLDSHEGWIEIVKPFDEAEAGTVRLPELGIRGNSHFPMSDRNSDEVFEIVMKRLETDRVGGES